MGPGTHTLTKLKNSVKPISRVDAAAMIHDIEYLNPLISESQADTTALSNAGSYMNPTKAIMKTGFMLKDLFGGYNPEKDLNKYYTARQMVDKNLSDVVKKYNLHYTPF